MDCTTVSFPLRNLLTLHVDVIWYLGLLLSHCSLEASRKALSPFSERSSELKYSSHLKFGGVSLKSSKRCATCVKLNIRCLYEVEEMKRKPFWIEARTHSDSGGPQRKSGQKLMPDVYTAPVFFANRWKSDVDSYVFECNKVMRRDEFASHYLFSHDLFSEMQPLRCPMWSHGQF